MRTKASASCRRADLRGRGGARPDGFTLVEILVVLTILAALAALALPQFVTMYTRVRAAFDRDELEQQLYALPQRVRATGRAGILETAPPADETAATPGDANFSLEQPQLLRLDLPEGWRMQVPRPVFYHFTGACEGGEVIFSLPPVTLRYQLVGPLCLPRPAR